MNSEKLKELLEEALWMDGADHKQWYLWEIAKELGFPESAFDSRESPEKGIAP